MLEKVQGFCETPSETLSQKEQDLGMSQRENVLVCFGTSNLIPAPQN